ncbi:AraC family transcriptional regulator [Prolixibacteraceae bacterium JC049]|nr:AraC family transcriptional regulator [Prolixibacteraceae bacterium JC049]
MNEILQLNTIAQAHQLLGDKPKHPLVSVIDFSKVENPPTQLPKIVIGFYCVIFKNDSNCEWKYGRNNYDFQEGTLVFLAPGQALELDLDQSGKAKNGWGLIFHPDLLLGTGLDLDQNEYSFFSYEVNEALHISDREKEIMEDLVDKIKNEIEANIDRHSKRLIVSSIELLLNYCVRFYDRQFITRSHKNNSFIAQFERVLKEYLNTEELVEKGLPSVTYLAEKVNLSSGYLSDLLKKETGKSAIEHIHYQLIEKAKYLLLNSNVSIKEIAFDLGFEYPQHFNKLFKKNTGVSPSVFRKSS